MKSIIVFLILSNRLLAQSYDNPQSNRGPDHGIGKKFSAYEWHGITSVSSELLANGRIYSYIRTAENDFKLSQKNGNKFIDIIPKLISGSFYAMDEYSRLLNVYEDSKVINIYSWGVQGYNFLFYQKRENQEPRLIRFGFIQNINHTYFAFDQSIQSIDFSGATQMKITTIPAVEDGKKGYYDFKKPGVYEFRPDGVYLDGVFDPSVPDYEPQDVVDENLRKDPQFYFKKQALHAERVASYTKEVMDAEAARIAALPPPPTLQPSVTPAVPASQPKSIAAAPSVPKPVVAAVAEAVLNRSLTAWLAGLVAILLGCFGWQYFRRKARP